jgi:phosphoglycerate dehydrogenase-like enzyme
MRLVRETYGLIDGRALSALRQGAYLFNASRGALVDYAALYYALANGHLNGTGVDVFWEQPVCPKDPLLAFPRVIATPHVAGVTDRSYGEIADAVAGNVERLRRGESAVNVIERC